MNFYVFDVPELRIESSMPYQIFLQLEKTAYQWAVHYLLCQCSLYRELREDSKVGTKTHHNNCIIQRKWIYLHLFRTTRRVFSYHFYAKGNGSSTRAQRPAELQPKDALASERQPLSGCLAPFSRIDVRTLLFASAYLMPWYKLWGRNPFAHASFTSLIIWNWGHPGELHLYERLRGKNCTGCTRPATFIELWTTATTTPENAPGSKENAS